MRERKLRLEREKYGEREKKGVIRRVKERRRER